MVVVVPPASGSLETEVLVLAMGVWSVHQVASRSPGSIPT